MCANGHSQNDHKLFIQPPVNKITKGMSINHLVKKRWSFTKATTEGNCQTCSQSLTQSVRKINHMPPVLTFKIGDVQKAELNLSESMNFSEHGENENSKFHYLAVAIIVRTETSYETFVKRNRVTEKGLIQNDWLKFSRGSFGVSSWLEVLEAGCPEVVMYRKVE